MANGYLKEENGEWRGRIQTMQIDLQIKLEVIPHDQVKVNGPVFNVLAKSPSGAGVVVGAAWKKEGKDGGPAFYSITLDDPSLPTKLNVTAFAAKEPGKFDIVWSRPRQKTEAA